MFRKDFGLGFGIADVRMRVLDHEDLPAEYFRQVYPEGLGLFSVCETERLRPLLQGFRESQLQGVYAGFDFQFSPGSGTSPRERLGPLAPVQDSDLDGDQQFLPVFPIDEGRLCPGGQDGKDPVSLDGRFFDGPRRRQAYVVQDDPAARDIGDAQRIVPLLQTVGGKRQGDGKPPGRGPAISQIALVVPPGRVDGPVDAVQAYRQAGRELRMRLDEIDREGKVRTEIEGRQPEAEYQRALGISGPTVRGARKDVGDVFHGILPIPVKGGSFRIGFPETVVIAVQGVELGIPAVRGAHPQDFGLRENIGSHKGESQEAKDEMSVCTHDYV